jgi:hypothetical protein
MNTEHDIEYIKRIVLELRDWSTVNNRAQCDCDEQKNNWSNLSTIKEAWVGGFIRGYLEGIETFAEILIEGDTA